MMDDVDEKILCSSTAPPRTVKFNVGGTVYEVSRSLLEQHQDTMLARMTCERWHQLQNTEEDDENGEGEATSSTSWNDPLFVEGDGPRFRHILEYMRRGKVWLPSSSCCVSSHFISRQALLDDLDYYGFHSVTPDQIQHDTTLDTAGPSAPTESCDASSPLVHQWCTELAVLVLSKYKSNPKNTSSGSTSNISKEFVVRFPISENANQNPGFRLASLVVLGHHESVLAARLEPLGLAFIKAEYVVQSQWKIHVCSSNHGSGNKSRSSFSSTSYAGGNNGSATQQFLLRRQGS